MSAALLGLGVALPKTGRKASRTFAKQAVAAAPARRVVLATAAKFEAASVATRVAAVLPVTLATVFAAPAFAAQELAQTANEVNILGVVAVAFFILIPVSFLLILYIKSSSEGNVSGGFSQEYYDESYKRGDKKAN